VVVVVAAERFHERASGHVLDVEVEHAAARDADFDPCYVEVGVVVVGVVVVGVVVVGVVVVGVVVVGVVVVGVAVGADAVVAGEVAVVVPCSVA
jgi:hypothetical protein